MESQTYSLQRGRTAQITAFAGCIVVFTAGIFERIIVNRPDYAGHFAPLWIPFMASLMAFLAILPVKYLRERRHIQRILLWIGLLLMVWCANGLPIDLMRMTGLIPLGIDWPGMITRALALLTAIALAWLAFSQTNHTGISPRHAWFAYIAFFLALPYPVLRTIWAFGGTLGILWPGAAGVGFVPWLASIPWLLAAVLSLMLVSPKSGLSRRIVLTSGWTATAIVGMVGPAAMWAIFTSLLSGKGEEMIGIKFWIPCLFYGSWFLWFIAAAAATRSFQIRSSDH